MPGILASGKRLEELCLWKLQGNRYGRCLDLSRERLSNFESYEAIGVDSKDGSPPKVAEDLNEFDSVEMVDLSHNFLQSADVILRLVPNAFWINLAYNDIEYIPDDVCLPTVMGSLNVSHNEALPLDSLEVLRNKYILRLFVDLGVARVRGKHGLPTENRSSEVYMKRIAELTSKCPNIWVVNDAYIPAVERGPTGQREQMTDTLITTEVVPRDGGGKKPNILLRLSTASDWCSRVPSPRESTFLSALQSFSSSHPLDMDCFSLDLAFEDYLEEARVANEKGVCYHGLKGHRYPTVDVNKVLGLSRELRLDLTVLLSSYIITGIPENIFQEAMQAVVGVGTMTMAEVKDICHLPEFAHTALICLLRRTIMKDHDDFYGDDDAAALKNLRMVSVQPRYIYEFTHLRGAHQLLHGPTGQNTGKVKHGRLPMLSRTRNNNNAPGKVPQSTPSAKEVNLLNLLPDIVTSRHKPMKDRDLTGAAADVGVHTIGSKSGSGVESGDTSGSWSEMLAVRTIELLEKSAEYRSQTNSKLPSSQTMADATLMLDPLIRTAYQQQGLHQGSFQENTLGDGELKSLSMVSEGADEGTETEFNERATEGVAEAQALALRDNSQASSKRLVVSLVSDNKDTSALLDAPTSLDLSMESGTSPLPKHKHQPQLLSDDGDARFALEIGDDDDEEEEGGSPAGLRLLPERGAQSLLSSAYPPSRVPAPTTDVALFTADRVAEAKFGLLPRKETLHNAKNSSEGVAMLHESPVFVQPYQLPKLEVESVSLDRLGPVPEGWQSDLHDNRSLGSSTAESTPSVMSTATAARTMLAEMGTLRNVRNMMRSENRQAQSKVDNTTWRPGSVGAGTGRDTGRSAESPPDIRLSTTFSAYGDALGGGGAGASAGAYGGEIATSWLSGLVHQPTRDEQKPASLSEFLENSWKAKEQEREEGLRASKEQRRKTPKNLQTRVVAGVNDKLISLTSPIDNLKMATKYRNINMHTSYEDGDGEVIYSQKTPEGRPLSATWYPVKDKKQYMVANSPNQNPLQVVTQETASWTVRQGSPTSRGGGYTVRPTSKSQILRGQSAVERSVNSKAINGHNEEYWPLPKHERQSEYTRAIKDTSDIILTASTAQQQQQQVNESTMLMKQKIHAGQYLRPSSRGPIPAATASLHLNSGYKIKEATHDDSPVRVLRATGQTVKMFRER